MSLLTLVFKRSEKRSVSLISLENDDDTAAEKQLLLEIECILGIERMSSPSIIWNVAWKCW